MRLMASFGKGLDGRRQTRRSISFSASLAPACPSCGGRSSGADLSPRSSASANQNAHDEGRCERQERSLPDHATDDICGLTARLSLVESLPDAPCGVPDRLGRGLNCGLVAAGFNVAHGCSGQAAG